VDGLTFVDHLIGHLMWPVIAIIVLVALYPVLRDRLSGLVRVKGAADPLRRDRLIRFGVISDASGVSEMRSTDAIVEAERIGLLDTSRISPSPRNRRSTTGASPPRC
jgi:hypothetical protein